MSTSTSARNNLDVWLQDLERFLNLMNTFWNSRQVSDLRSKFALGGRQKANVRGAILTGYAYVNQAVMFRRHGAHVSPRNLTQGAFILKLYAERPHSRYDTSFFEVDVGGRRYLFLANIYSGPRPLNINLDIALIDPVNWYLHNRVGKLYVIFFTECKYSRVYPQTYGAVTGQRYLTKSGSRYADIRDALITAHDATTSVNSTSAYVWRVIQGVSQGRVRKYDPVLITNVRPTNNQWYQKIDTLINAVIQMI